MFVFIKMIII